jgi:hypothetical protein
MKAYDELFKDGKIKCKTCKQEKNLSEFWKDKSRKRGHDTQCKDCSKKRQRNEWSRFSDHPARMYNRLLQLCSGARVKKGLSQHKLNISKQDFIKWYSAIEKKCEYCNLELESFKKINKYFGKQTQATSRFGIDRKNNSVSYEIGNIVLCCVICNKLKGYFHEYESFKKIADEFVKPKLNKLLKNEKNIGISA